jgi:hypothetical protein
MRDAGPLPGRAVRPTLSVGPAVAFEARCRAHHEASTPAALIGCEEGGRVRTDAVLLAGAGLEYDVGRA